MSITRRRRDIADFLQKWLEKVNPKYPAIFEDQHEPRPKGPHFTFKVSSFMRVGLDDITYFDQALDSQMQRGHREFIVSFKAAGSPLEGSNRNYVSGLDMLGELQFALETPSWRQEFSKAGIGISDAQQIVDTTDLEDNLFIPRAVWDVRMNTTITQKIDTGFIEHVAITGSVEEIEITPITVSRP